jgi:MerR family transcriptional regulator, light-induced transcriptional regulator
MDPLEFNTEFVEALLKGNKPVCSRILHDHLDKDPDLLHLYEKLLRPAMYWIGELWEQNRISVATEHLASSITDSLLNEAYLRTLTPSEGVKSVILSCIEKEEHQIGIKMVSDVFELAGWKTYFLGAKTPVQELIRFAKQIQPTAIALSLSIYSHLPFLLQALESIQKSLPEIHIYTGGQAFRYGGTEEVNRFQNVYVITDLYELKNFISSPS